MVLVLLWIAFHILSSRVYSSTSSRMEKLSMDGFSTMCCSFVCFQSKILSWRVCYCVGKGVDMQNQHSQKKLKSYQQILHLSWSLWEQCRPWIQSCWWLRCQKSSSALMKHCLCRRSTNLLSVNLYLYFWCARKAWRLASTRSFRIAFSTQHIS